MAVLVALVGGVVGYLFYHNAHTVSLLLGPQSSFELPVAALVLGALAIGAGLVLLGGLLRSSVTGVSSWRQQRRERRHGALLRVREQGRRYLWSGDFESATRALARYVARHPKDLDAVLELAHTYEARGELETARRVLELARGEVGSDPRLLHELGRLARKRGNAGAAIDWLQEAVQQHPDSPRLLAELAEALAAEGRFAEASDVAHRCLAAEREPSRREEARNRAIAMRYRAAQALEDPAASEQALRRLVTDAPDFVPAIVALAARARATNDLRTAERVLRDAIRRAPRGVLLERFFALHANAGQPERALPVLRDACSGNSLAAPRLMLARALVAAGKHPAAESELSALVKDTPAYRAEGVDIGPERDLVAGELALARGHDREAATLLGRAATGSHRPFVHACVRCEREYPEWRDQCACGAYGTIDWLTALAPLDRERQPRSTQAAML